MQPNLYYGRRTLRNTCSVCMNVGHTTAFPSWRAGTGRAVMARCEGDRSEQLLTAPDLGDTASNCARAELLAATRGYRQDRDVSTKTSRPPSDGSRPSSNLTSSSTCATSSTPTGTSCPAEAGAGLPGPGRAPDPTCNRSASDLDAGMCLIQVSIWLKFERFHTLIKQFRDRVHAAPRSAERWVSVGPNRRPTHSRGEARGSRDGVPVRE